MLRLGANLLFNQAPSFHSRIASNSTIMAQSRERAKSAFFALWAATLGFVTLAEFPYDSFFGWVIILLSLSLQAFLVYKTLYTLDMLSERAQRLHKHVYENRNGSMKLLGLAVIWIITVLSFFFLVLLDVWMGGRLMYIIAILSKHGGKVLMWITLIVYLFSALLYISMALWLLYTVAKAVWRVAAPVERDEFGEVSLPLVSGGNGSDRWR